MAWQDDLKEIITSKGLSATGLIITFLSFGYHFWEKSNIISYVLVGIAIYFGMQWLFSKIFIEHIEQKYNKLLDRYETIVHKFYNITSKQYSSVSNSTQETKDNNEKLGVTISKPNNSTQTN